jgi:GNAT superfamily N-acetyltransferase
MSPLDNPVWNSLTTLHDGLAESHGALRRYPPDIAPFLATTASTLSAADLDALVRPAETMICVGFDAAIPDGWQRETFGPLLQMICESDVAVPDGPEIVPLDESHRAAILALTARVYPHYFRPRTPILGRYFGLFVDGTLAAMIGERMGLPGGREVSAVCTYPEHAGRGYARRLLTYLANDIRQSGATPFLHVSAENPRAVQLYEQNGWRVRTTLPFWSLTRSR